MFLIDRLHAGAVDPAVTPAAAHALRGDPALRLEQLRSRALRLFQAMVLLCGALFLAALFLSRPWIQLALVGTWICIAVAAVALLLVHVLAGSARHDGWRRS